jgi:hypothetical protein
MYAVALSQFQQSCEKALKALVLEVCGRDLYGAKVRPSHWVWSVDLRDGRLKKPREVVRQLLDGLPEGEAKLQQLEALAPKMSWEDPNPEYPWVDAQGLVCVPGSHFAKELSRFQDLTKFARQLVVLVAQRQPRWQKLWGRMRSPYGGKLSER